MIDPDTFSAIAPVLGQTKSLALPPSSTVCGGQYGTKNVTFELSLHAAFVADEVWDFMLESARMEFLTAERAY